MVFRDYYFNKIKKFIDKEQIKVITGIRRSGKSTLLKLLKEELLKKSIKADQILYLIFRNLNNSTNMLGITSSKERGRICYLMKYKT